MPLTALILRSKPLNLVEVTGLEPAASCSQTQKCRFFPYFTRLFGAFVSEINAFGCSCQHCFHVVRSCRWSNLWSSSLGAEMNASRKSKIQLRMISYTAVIIPYFRKIVNHLLSKRKNCGAVVKENARRKSWIYFRKRSGLPSPSVVLLCANRRCSL